MDKAALAVNLITGLVAFGIVISIFNTGGLGVLVLPVVLPQGIVSYICFCAAYGNKNNNHTKWNLTAHTLSIAWLCGLVVITLMVPDALKLTGYFGFAQAFNIVYFWIKSKAYTKAQQAAPAGKAL